MSVRERIVVSVSPWTSVLLAVFIALVSPAVLIAVLVAAVCHEMGHYLALRAAGGTLSAVHITAFGAEMELSPRCCLSYGEELLAVAAGPVVNLVLAPLLSAAGGVWEEAYLAAGSSLVLGLFNLLPVDPLDGGRLLWLAVAWLTDPFLADRVLRLVGSVAALALLLLGGWVWYRSGSPFLFCGAAGIAAAGWKEKGLVKTGKSR